MANKGLYCFRNTKTLNSQIIKKIKSPFLIYADFESMLLPEDNGKKNPKTSYTKKYQKHIAAVVAIN